MYQHKLTLEDHETEPKIYGDIVVADIDISLVRPCIDLGAKLHAESEFSKRPYNEDKLLERAVYWMYDPDVMMKAAIDKEGDVVGMMIAYANDYFFCDYKTVRDLLFYVDRRRGKGVGNALFAELINWAENIGASDLFVSVNSNISDKAVSRYLERKGFKLRGYNFQMELM